MSMRGQGRGRGRGGRPRGSTNKPKTQTWEWEDYTPGPEVYNELFHLRKAPPIITRNLSNDCPIPDAQSRIVTRRQTEDGHSRNFYIVQVRYFPEKDASPSEDGDSDMRDEDEGTEETVEVDMSRILRYVSQRELERFENAEFRAEAEAEAIQKRAEAEELARRRLERNAKIPGAGRGRGSKMRGGLGLPGDEMPRELEAFPRALGRGRPRGRGRGRGRSRGRGDHALGVRIDDQSPSGLAPGEVEFEDAMDVETTEELAERIVAETEDEDEEEDEEDIRAKQTSPDLMRSAFVISSALSTSPVALHRGLATAPAVRRGQPEVPDIKDSDDESMSSAAAQLMSERRVYQRPASDPEEDSEDNGHLLQKKGRAQGTSSFHKVQASQTPSALRQRFPSLAHRTPKQYPSPSNHNSEEEPDSDSASAHPPAEPMDTGDDDQSQDAESEPGDDYLIDSILDHSYVDGITYYLVKWYGFEDASDWIPREKLDGALDLVDEYDERVRRKTARAQAKAKAKAKGKGKGKGKSSAR